MRQMVIIQTSEGVVYSKVQFQKKIQTALHTFISWASVVKGKEAFPSSWDGNHGTLTLDWLHQEFRKPNSPASHESYSLAVQPVKAMSSLRKPTRVSI